MEVHIQVHITISLSSPAELRHCQMGDVPERKLSEARQETTWHPAHPDPFQQAYPSTMAIKLLTKSL